MLLACAGGTPTVELLPVLGVVPPFMLTDTTGATITTESLRGAVWVADFIFTSCPDVCPVLSAHMAEVQAHYVGNPRVRLVSFSVDPDTDTPPVLAAYGARFGADPARWSFLTGPADTLEAVVVDGFKMMLERVEARGGAPGGSAAPAPATVLHGERFVVVDTLGRIRAYPDPKEPGKVEIYAAVAALLEE
ncbi:MAG: SCO family protein [Pseudomonadota bacterium]|nr:SCO family protein [Pseudomonadota bacterium]